MRNPLRRRRHSGPLTISLCLKRLDDLFETPDTSPFDPAFAPYSFGPAIDYVAAEMRRLPDAERVELHIVLPVSALTLTASTSPIAMGEGGRAVESQSIANLEARTREAIGRYAIAWSTAQEQQRDVGLRQARTVAGSAIAFFAVATFLSLQYARDGELFGLTGDVVDVLLDGLGVGAWVALWWPFDQLFQWWQGRLEDRTYRSLPGIAVRVTLEPEAQSRVES
jgi:hypothetical protein